VIPRLFPDLRRGRTTVSEHPTPQGSPPLALVYRGKAGAPGCSEAVVRLLRSSRWGFDVRYVGPKEDILLSAEVLANAAVYAQPGGGSLKKSYRRMEPHSEMIRNYVGSGGRYLGFCLGGYLAGATPGFALLPGDADQYIASRGATLRTDTDTVIEVRWRDRSRYMYFQDGPCFRLIPGADGVTVLGTYPNGEIASLVAPFGAGRVAVVGPHPEATPDWYEDYALVDPDGLDTDLGHDLVDTLMA
jgi:glutamine amidotransferase-like uncharacterized protein